MNKRQAIDKITASYLNLQTPRENRGNIIAFFIIFLDIMGLLPILGEPFSFQFFWPAIIPVGLLHLWAILYIVAPYKFEQSYYLFFGIYSVVNTYIYFLVIQKLLYVNIGVESQIPFLVGLLLLICLLVFFQYFNIKMLYSGNYAKLQKNGSKSKMNLSPFLTASSIGYVIAQILMASFMTDSIFNIIIISGVSIMSILTAFFSISIHRFFFIKKNQEAVRKVYPEFGLPKKHRKNQ
ncbi:hypothetical protein ACFOUV_15855 [Oceanobacillus longus]|uniref:Uncharacterized protein n=1 Tax=Oceanobacillus longus TaxID=930120 RepID=A0ABV8H273_9BACI